MIKREGIAVYEEATDILKDWLQEERSATEFDAKFADWVTPFPMTHYTGETYILGGFMGNGRDCWLHLLQCHVNLNDAKAYDKAGEIHYKWLDNPAHIA